ncbi:Hypothetical predicted protein [Lecanosticta acicola]|uniref:AB hydrolase-1 domain-containing protein n=1 Tax=Lecanosticta acicola TaxID=111012 RepID=A0AAI8Z046_9PEZI|nr:Hypothetical predicted protein [Lecanosticta acicola]
MEVGSRAPSAEPWNPSPTDPSSSPNHVRTRRRRSPNRVKAKPANPQVISSILTSLDTLTPLPANDDFSETASRRSHPDSSSRSVAGSASIYRAVSSPGFGVEYGVGLELDYEEGLSDAALPPTVPTSRSPSRSSTYTVRKSPAFTGPMSSRARSRSRRSSLSANGTRAGSTRKKLSSESWVRRTLDADDGSSFTSRGRTPRKSLRRIGSQEMLRSDDFGFSPNRASPAVSLAEQIIARTPPAPSSRPRGRLYLHDATINEDQALAESPESPESPSPIQFSSTRSPGRTPDIENWNSREESAHASELPQPQTEERLQSELEKPVAVNATPPLKTPSPIADSIPTRTSSLRQPSNGPAAVKKKHRRTKRHTVAPSKSENMKPAYKRSKSIPDSSWADLGEDDETVRRIRQLREQRKSRLQESTSVSSPIGEEADEISIPVYELAAPQTEEVKPTTRTQPEAGGDASTPIKGKQLLKVEDEGGHFQVSNGSRRAGVRPVSVSPDAKRQSNLSLEVKRALSEQYRPASSKSEDNSTNQLASLDYSYAQAVDALNNANGVERKAGSSRSKPNRELSERSSLPVSDLSSPTSIHQTKPALPKTKQSKKPKSVQDRWTNVHHPDLPQDFERRKSRRKSMSDARLAQAIEEEGGMSRRDSIGNAVNEYLDSPRLTKFVKNPTTGRKIAFSEVGDPQGGAVFVCVGMGLTRFVTAFFDELAVMLRLRLITLDRPGVGASEPLPPTDKSGPLKWPEDVLAVCQHLGIIKFSILAHSAGAIYALATALILPHLVQGKVHLLAPWVPPSQLEAISHPAASALPANPLPRSQRFLRVLPTPFLKAANSSFMTATSASLKPATKRNSRTNTAKTTPRKGAETDDSPKRRVSHDRRDHNRRESMMLMDQFMPGTNPMENFSIPSRAGEEKEGQARVNRGSLILSATASPADPNFAYAINGLNAAEHAEKERQTEYTSRLTQRTWDLATRDSNPATDLLVCLERNRDVGFRYTDVGREVVITHGSEDKRVPIANVKWLAEQMNRRALGLDLSARESRESWADPSAKGGCEVRVLEGEGHGLMASPAIMSDVLTEIAGYWMGQDKGRL